ncbi:hypothetical protein DFJ73DRAFT_809698 [Zopfochytrium polystomum]|nr:hypothetical protein DFJ73DRAFT_809698 [Zopfochytrium polystomum]
MKRLKNTEAARRSRARKLVKMESLLATVQDLESENTKLVSHLALLENERAAWETKHREYCLQINRLEELLGAEELDNVTGPVV